MQRYTKVKTDLKDSRNKQSYNVASVATKWKLPLALSILAFVLIWKLNLFQPLDPEQEMQDWLDPNQVTLDVLLPESVEETSITLQKENMNSPEWKTFSIKAGDNLAHYFQEAGLDSKALHEVLSLGRDAQHLKKIYPGQVLKIEATHTGKLKSLQFDVDPLTTLIVNRQENGKLISKIDNKPIEKRVAFGGGKIFDSFFVAGKQAKLDDALIMELANVFAYDIDFALDIKPNDHFKVLFEEYFVNGIKVGNGPIVAAEFVNNGKQYQAIRYTDKTGSASYYSTSGQSLKKAFIRTPVQFTRISSHFNLERRHPILHKIRAHRGVDYAAPHGTPVKAAGQGRIVFAGKKGGYGNTIIVQHGPKYTTLYAHLANFAKNLRSGQSIKQGQIIGYVGATGLASGPHLHYEFRVNGIHHNPLTVALPQAEAVPHHEKSKFLAHAGELLRTMEMQGKVFLASND